MLQGEPFEEHLELHRIHIENVVGQLAFPRGFNPTWAERHRQDSGDVELRVVPKFADARLGALVAAVNAERVVGFPSGRLFLDSIEQALAVALVNNYGVRRPSPRMYRGGLIPPACGRLWNWCTPRWRAI